MTKERIEIIRQSLIPFAKKQLLEINYDGLGKSDAKEFEKDLNEVLDLAIKALEQQSSEDCVSRMEVLRIVSNFWLNKDIDNKVFSRITDCFNAMPYVLPKLPTSEDCVSRAELKKWLDMNFSFGGALRKLEMFDRIDKELLPVTPIHGTCKDCKHNKKSRALPSMCDLCHRFELRESSIFYCADFEKQINIE